MTLERTIDERSTSALDPIRQEPAAAAALAAIDERVRREASTTLMGTDVSLVTETGLSPASVRQIVDALLGEYAARKEWDCFNALARLYRRQFDDHNLTQLRTVVEDAT